MTPNCASHPQTPAPAAPPMGSATAAAGAPAQCATVWPPRWLLLSVVGVFLLLAVLFAALIPVLEGFDAQTHYAAVDDFRIACRRPLLDDATAARSDELAPHPPFFYALAALASSGWPEDAALTAAAASLNAYFDVVLSSVRLHAPAPGPATAGPGGAPLATSANGIALASARLRTDAAGLPSGVDLTWTATANVHEEYAVFVQVLDGADRMLAQSDRQPQAGHFPTSTWRAGDCVDDQVELQGDVAGWQRVIVGLYGADGQRLSLAPEIGGNADLLAVRER